MIFRAIDAFPFLSLKVSCDTFLFYPSNREKQRNFKRTETMIAREVICFVTLTDSFSVFAATQSQNFAFSCSTVSISTRWCSLKVKSFLIAQCRKVFISSVFTYFNPSSWASDSFSLANWGAINQAIKLSDVSNFCVASGIIVHTPSNTAVFTIRCFTYL